MSMRQISGPDAAFLYGERPEWHFHVSGLIIVDPSTSDRFSADELEAQLERRLDKVPQFRWKLLEGPLHLRLERPLWIDDPHFDVHRHVNRVSLPSPGDERALGELVGRLISFKIDRTRPLWDLWIIEGLADGRIALLMKIHHSIIDGESGAEMVTLLFDLEANPTPEPDPEPWEPEPPPAMVNRLALATRNAAGWPFRATRFTRQLVRQGVTMGRHAFGDDAAAMPLQAPRTPLNGELTPDRAFASAALSLSEARRVKEHFGVKLNDVVLAISAGALRSYLLEIDELPETPLIAQVPVSLRDPSNADHMGTKVANMFASLETHVADPVERVRSIHHGTAISKEMRRELTELSEVNLTDTTAPAFIAVAARTWSLAGLDERTPPVFNVIVSNVAGPEFDLYVAGARIEAMYPMGPLLMGSGVNLTIASAGDSLHVGVVSCPERMPDPWLLADAFAPALAELVTAVDDDTS